MIFFIFRLKKYDGKKIPNGLKFNKHLVRDYKALNSNKISQKMFKLKLREEETNKKIQGMKSVISQVETENLSKVKNKTGKSRDFWKF